MIKAFIDTNVLIDLLSDALQYFSAGNVNADVIVTRNEKDFSFSLIRVVSPKDFLEELVE